MQVTDGAGASAPVLFHGRRDDMASKKKPMPKGKLKGKSKGKPMF
jgi:hypothetical protein